MAPLRIGAFTATSAAGRGNAAILGVLRSRTSGLSRNDFGAKPIDTYIGRVNGIEDEPLPKNLAEWDCRNNRLAWLGLNQDEFMRAVNAARQRYGRQRVAIVLGTSTSSIGATEEAYRSLDKDDRFPQHLLNPFLHTPHSTGDFLRHALSLDGICVTVGTACSSSAKVFAQAERLIRNDLADAVVVGGADSLCGSVLFGFNSLDLVSREKCRPFDVARDGINLGEAAGFALIERQGSGPALLGYGESSDAFHMSSPHPQGLGARSAIAETLARAGLSAEAVDYVNLHGTASRKNDEIEAKVIGDLFSPNTLASSTKGWTGHTLGAAGILEAVITLLALEHSFVPGTLNTTRLDPACNARVCIENTDASLRTGMSLSFGFGGSNCAVLFGRSS
ncbi:MAG: beta-ketoacyl-[acyl-carrier-protein] synthase family protein [Betaproteobacteria bacterium]|nr:MAG: beta-ketoacyl-[acyl-carrier-protein] synthase family protein [Betaproteobacteria bacterium]